ncbi:hypothetical protein A3736_05805 [Erythrobacter sp. HI0063]|jgi:hypothetical protein|uniref:DUF1993 domain-containing protein n=1 Tax=Erythrobacter sp. HI0063 TaxID=1822240 RepID=UPI0007C2FC57|nr:DUF1993 domain-containing protein [Erythrobacter sp. HI0063]KZY57356.1 hypothetical protein A3736_05805 [Erythrobacter sp. HI0063]
MPISLHAAFVPSALQIIGSTRGLIDTADTWCDEQGRAAETVLGARIYEDMLPFAYQVKSVAVHTQSAIAALNEGRFSPDMAPPPASFDGLRAQLDEARAALEKVGLEELEEKIGQEVRFEFGKLSLPFDAEDFLLSFSQPNYAFHAATAYDILRMLGIKIGKTDFLGRLRMRR